MGGRCCPFGYQIPFLSSFSFDWIFSALFDQDEENLDVDQMEEDGDLADIEALNYDDLDNVSKLQKSRRYVEIMQVYTYLIFNIITSCPWLYLYTTWTAHKYFLLFFPVWIQRCCMVFISEV